MVTRDTAWPTGTPCWVDLTTSDLAASTEFYRALFGWRIGPGAPEYGGYTNAEVDGRPVAGLAPQRNPQQPTGWTTYLAAADLDAVAARVVPAGGQLSLPPMDVMDLGRMAVALDPAGNMFGLWQAGAHLGAHLVNVPNTVSWNENLTDDADACRAFYGDVFGYSFHDIGGTSFTYQTFGADPQQAEQHPGGGIGGRSAGPSGWLVYFGVADTDATVATATDLGATVLDPAHDSPYGRLAKLSDPHGATFAVIEVPAD